MPHTGNGMSTLTRSQALGHLGSSLCGLGGGLMGGLWGELPGAESMLSFQLKVGRACAPVRTGAALRPWPPRGPATGAGRDSEGGMQGSASLWGGGGCVCGRACVWEKPWGRACVGEGTVGEGVCGGGRLGEGRALSGNGLGPPLTRARPVLRPWLCRKHIPTAALLTSTEGPRALSLQQGDGEAGASPREAEPSRGGCPGPAFPPTEPEPPSPRRRGKPERRPAAPDLPGPRGPAPRCTVQLGAGLRAQRVPEPGSCLRTGRSEEAARDRDQRLRVGRSPHNRGDVPSKLA